jgi:NAD(P)-dependent dehydrogenase (short-subunit alcohol dehydrogenase family)
MKSDINLTEDEWDRVIDINLKGVWNWLRFQIPEMLEQGRRAISSTGSVSGLTGFPPLLPTYIASKYGVVDLTAAIARTYASQGNRVNAICPGAIATRAQIVRRSLPGKPSPVTAASSPEALLQMLLTGRGPDLASASRAMFIAPSSPVAPAYGSPATHPANALACAT